MVKPSANKITSDVYNFLFIPIANAFHNALLQTGWTASKIGPDIFFFVFQESRLYFFKKMEKKFLDFFIADRMTIVPNLKKNETNWVRNYILLCKKNTLREKKSLKSQLWLYLHVYLCIVASICFVEMDLCLFVHFF